MTPKPDTRTVGAGPKQTAVWLDTVPITLAGLEEWPKVGDRYVIDGKLWRVVERIGDRIELEVVASERLGHASVVITLDTYSHVLPTMQQDATEKLAGVLYGSRK